MTVPIYLVGFMGCGKTSLGKKLAKKLNLTFYDLDEIIESSEEKSITQIFAESGEECFRKIESEYLKGVSNTFNSVIALGGGAACSKQNLDLLKATGSMLYLKMSEARLLGRLRLNKLKRPLIANLTDQELKEFIHKKLNEREMYYSQANIIYEVTGKNVDELVGMLGYPNS